MGFITCIMACCTHVLAPDWNKIDDVNLDHARTRCREMYKESRCLVKFTKVEERVYRAICGKDNN